MAAITVAGSIAQRPSQGGHAWVFLNYLLGLKGLSHDVLFIDRLSQDMLGEAGDGQNAARSPQAEWLREVMTNAGFADQYLLLTDSGQDDQAAISRCMALERLSETDVLINVNGFLDDPELLEAPTTAIFLDIDPAIQQMWEDLGLSDLFKGHDLYFSVGENLGRPACAVPTCGYNWQSTRAPIALDDWPATHEGESFTTVGSWRGPYGPIEYGDQTYGLRVHEFRRFIDLPSLVAGEWMVAMDIDPADQEDVDNLLRSGWELIDPGTAAGSPASYQSFIQGSMAEFSVAKNVYVESECGWFSDRSASYLASGKPVLAQDTGFSMNLPTGEGLLSYTDLDGAVAGAEEILGNWSFHSKAAHELAVEYFDSRKVLGAILDAANI
jgi:hypothetical protein